MIANSLAIVFLLKLNDKHFLAQYFYFCHEVSTIVLAAKNLFSCRVSHKFLSPTIVSLSSSLHQPTHMLTIQIKNLIPKAIEISPAAERLRLTAENCT